MKLGTLVNHYLKARDARMEIEKGALAKARAKELKAQADLQAAMNAERTDRAETLLGMVSLKVKDVPKVFDWNVFDQWTAKHAATHLYQRRLNESNVAEMLEHDAKLKKTGIDGMEFIQVQVMTATRSKS